MHVNFNNLHYIKNVVNINLLRLSTTYRVRGQKWNVIVNNRSSINIYHLHVDSTPGTLMGPTYTRPLKPFNAAQMHSHHLLIIQENIKKIKRKKVKCAYNSLGGC